ncbi:hypothetical protein NDU88_003376 [Pleurodeles waltl]|uniref:Uncharacterized protein n=1 Tax=Pleurodeles waltl TaxID=8319 RepID=A0AAV7T553_PLEWA|nr:hypothetical protein NDU88_003376 [Pleurodeles waltl]
MWARGATSNSGGESRTAPPGSHRSSGQGQYPAPRGHSRRPDRPPARPAGTGRVGAQHAARLTGRNAPGIAARTPGRPGSFNRRGVKQGTGGAGTGPALRLPPSARCKQRVGSAAGSKARRTPVCISQALPRVTQQGSARTKRSAQLTSTGRTPPAPRPTHPGALVALVGRSSGGGPRGPGNPRTPSTAQCTVRSNKAHTPGKGRNATSSFLVPPRAPSPPDRRSSNACSDVRRDLCTRLSHFGMRHGTSSLNYWWAVSGAPRLSVRSGSHLGHAPTQRYLKLLIDSNIS